MIQFIKNLLYPVYAKPESV